MLLALVACQPTADTAVDTAPVSQVYEDCDPSILIPVGNLAEAPEDPADAHAETYGTETPDPFHVRYQWPARDPSKSAGFLWRTDLDTLASQLQIGPASGFPDNATTHDGGSFLFGTGTVGEGAYRAHEVRVCGQLEPDTVYSYRVGGEGHWSSTFGFSTPAAPNSFDTFRVGIAGDSRGAYDTWGQVLAAMDAHEPDFFLVTGDLIELGTSQSEWDDWFEASGSILAQKALISAHGNHEFLAQNYFAQFAFPGNEEWFAVEYGDALFLTLNDTVRDSEHLATVQVDFLQQELSAFEGRWTVGNHHQSTYSTCSTHNSDLTAREAWTPVFDEHEVDVVFAGHNHVYERSVPIRNDTQVAASDGTIYVVTGGAGAPLYNGFDEDWFNAVATSTEHYLIADFGPSAIDVVARDLKGNVIDSFSIAR